MMISPESFVEEFKNKSLKECIKERNSLIKSLQRYEKYFIYEKRVKLSSGQYLDEIIEEGMQIFPNPQTVYSCELQYLTKLCQLIEEKYEEYKEDNQWMMIIYS